jgi:hypothetical protein
VQRCELRGAAGGKSRQSARTALRAPSLHHLIAMDRGAAMYS